MIGSKFIRIVTAALLVAPISAADMVKFENSKYGYALEYPLRWYPQIASNVFCIENFPPEKAVPITVLPDRGAQIKILVPTQTTRSGQKLPTTPEEWAAAGAARREVISKARIEIAKGNRSLTITELQTRCCAVTPYDESIEWYFEVEGRMFLASAIYKPGDPGRSSYRDTMQMIVLTLRVTEKQGGGERR